MIVLLGAGAVFVLLGALAYSGLWRSWTATYVYRPYPLLGALWMGIALLLFALGIRTNAAGWAAATVVVEVFAFLFGAIGVMSARWMPRALRPRWFRSWQSDGSRRIQYARPRGRRLSR